MNILTLPNDGYESINGFLPKSINTRINNMLHKMGLNSTFLIHRLNDRFLSITRLNNKFLSVIWCARDYLTCFADGMIGSFNRFIMAFQFQHMSIVA